MNVGELKKALENVDDDLEVIYYDYKLEIKKDVRNAYMDKFPFTYHGEITLDNYKDDKPIDTFVLEGR